MRTRPYVYGTTGVGPLEVDQIDLAVKAVSERLVRTARFLRTFERLATQDRLRVGDKREALLSFAFDKAGEYDRPRTRSGGCSARRLPRDPEPLGPHEAPRRRRPAGDLETDLATDHCPVPNPSGMTFEAARGVLLAFLNDEHLRYSAPTPPSRTRTPATRWEAARNSDVARWHVLAHGVGLTSLPAPQMATCPRPTRK